MIPDLFAPLASLLRGNSTLMEYASGVYVGSAPQNQGYGYVVGTEVAETTEHTHTSRIQRSLWQFSCYHYSLGTLGAILGQVDTILDRGTLALNTTTNLAIIREGGGGLVLDHVDQRYGNIWHQYLEFMFWVQ